MQVINIIVTNPTVFIDTLERELIKLEISYVKIENEIHFLNRIYRFYENKETIALKNIPLQITDCCEELIQTLEMFGSRNYKPEVFNYEEEFLPTKKEYKPPTKQLIKKNNLAVNRLNKNYNRQIKGRK